MTPEEVLSALLTQESRHRSSAETKKFSKMVIQMYNNMNKTFTKNQRKIFLEYEALVNTRSGEIFLDGVLYGWKLAESLKQLMREPEKIFENLREGSAENYNKYMRDMIGQNTSVKGK